MACKLSEETWFHFSARRMRYIITPFADQSMVILFPASHGGEYDCGSGLMAHWKYGSATAEGWSLVACGPPRRLIESLKANEGHQPQAPEKGQHDAVAGFDMQ